MKYLKLAVTLIIVIAILFFVTGFILLFFDLWEKSSFINTAAIVGGIVSVASLTSFLLPSIKKDDIERVGIEYLKDVVNSAEELKEKENELRQKEKQLSSKEKELNELEIKKKAMEVLVRKASLRLFLEDQLERNTQKIKSIIENKSELRELLDERIPLMAKLQGVQGEIENDPNVEFLEDIMISINPRYSRSTNDEYLKFEEPKESFISHFSKQLIETILR